ncbi:phosphatidylglycerophosphatase A family protein [Mangrovitalea sediminis]|uniref:phosphatidylglycerophosphatase A family protein n=1 Tax=Mangrovitalea sediminis TaxID=1982043 RepID=UPI000BE5F21B|nr:phosphatidylglycerophosphatase A [Mangrovitalea sediminis]
MSDSSSSGKPTPPPLPPGFLRDPLHLLAFGLGSGAIRPAPGTWGSLAALPLYALLRLMPAWAYGVMLIAAFVFGVYLCGRTSRALNVHDHSGIVWDEFVGMWLTLVLRPSNLWVILLGFALFRLFDIVKPWPIGWLDRRVPGGVGIMLDDVIAGLYALIALVILQHFLALGGSWG